jgi:hypothetical protein
MSAGLCGQHVTIAVGPGTPNFGRPVYDAITQLQRLTTIPINYEDLQYNYVGDVKDIGSSTRVLVPKGGSFFVNVPVDPATRTRGDALSVSTALNIVIAAAQTAGVVPGTFHVDSSQRGIFITTYRGDYCLRIWRSDQRIARDTLGWITSVLPVIRELSGGQMYEAIMRQLGCSVRRFWGQTRA